MAAAVTFVRRNDAAISKPILSPFPRVYPILDTTRAEAADLDIEILARALSESTAIRIVQYRHKGRFTRERFAEAQRVAKILRKGKVCFVVNDRADIAMALGADGVHVGQRDLPPSVVRKIIGNDMLLGYSTHNAAQLEDGECRWADYLAIGPVFATASKRNPDPVVGLDGLSVARALTSKPLVAIGGVALENARELFSTGADSVAMISGLTERNLFRWNELEDFDR